MGDWSGALRLLVSGEPHMEPLSLGGVPDLGHMALSLAFPTCRGQRGSCAMGLGCFV